MKMKRASAHNEIGQRCLGEVVGKHLDLLSSRVKSSGLQKEGRKDNMTVSSVSASFFF